jgi:NAD(P)-dependent dehydrogenase (short-subunit alcohol dehydrogenase family)
VLLEKKNAVIYGAGGSIGGAVARAFAREGARVFLAGRTLAKLDAVAKEIFNAEGSVETAEVEALDQKSIEGHLAEVARKAGTIDISFNAIGLGDAQGEPLVEMSQERFAFPIVTAMTTHFLTATTAARHMSTRGSGVILAITANAGRKPYPVVGGFGVACAAIEGFCRQLAAEVGPQGIRVVCLLSAGSPDAPGVDQAFRRVAEGTGVSREGVEAEIAERTMLKRLPTLAEVANVAVLMASDRASAITGAVANVTCGEIVD